MSPEVQTQLAHQLLDAFCKADWEAYRSMVTPDVTYEESGTGRRIKGVDAYLELLKGWHIAFPDISFEAIDAITQEAQVALRVLWKGTHNGPLQTPEMTVPATGRSIEVAAVMWSKSKDGRVSSIFHSLDVMGMMAQLGLMDSAAPPA
jgi:steroid delta-isomerase-like uncharacterized protein